MLARFPAVPGGQRDAGRARRWPPCRCGSRAGSSASFVAIWTTDHPFADDDVEVLEALAAQIALSVSRLRADDERDAAVAAMAEANQRLQLLADAGPGALRTPWTSPSRSAQLADLVVPALGDWCWLVVTDEHGRLHELASRAPRPGPTRGAAAYVRVDGGGR